MQICEYNLMLWLNFYFADITIKTLQTNYIISIIVINFSNFLENLCHLDGDQKLGAVHKRRPYKIAKNWPPPPCLQNVRTGQTPPSWLRMSFMDGPLVKTRKGKTMQGRFCAEHVKMQLNHPKELPRFHVPFWVSHYFTYVLAYVQVQDLNFGARCYKIGGEAKLIKILNYFWCKIHPCFSIILAKKISFLNFIEL